MLISRGSSIDPPGTFAAVPSQKMTGQVHENGEKATKTTTTGTMPDYNIKRTIIGTSVI